MFHVSAISSQCLDRGTPLLLYPKPHIPRGFLGPSIAATVHGKIASKIPEEKPGVRRMPPEVSMRHAQSLGGDSDDGINNQTIMIHTSEASILPRTLSMHTFIWCDRGIVEKNANRANYHDTTFRSTAIPQETGSSTDVQLGSN